MRKGRRKRTRRARPGGLPLESCKEGGGGEGGRRGGRVGWREGERARRSFVLQLAHPPVFPCSLTSHESGALDRARRMVAGGCVLNWRAVCACVRGEREEGARRKKLSAADFFFFESGDSCCKGDSVPERETCQGGNGARAHPRMTTGNPTHAPCHFWGRPYLEQLNGGGEAGPATNQMRPRERQRARWLCLPRSHTLAVATCRRGSGSGRSTQLGWGARPRRRARARWWRSRLGFSRGERERASDEERAGGWASE